MRHDGIVEFTLTGCFVRGTGGGGVLVREAGEKDALYLRSIWKQFADRLIEKNKEKIGVI